MKGAGSEPMEIPVICRKDKLPKLKKQISRIKSMVTFKNLYQKLS